MKNKDWFLVGFMIAGIAVLLWILFQKAQADGMIWNLINSDPIDFGNQNPLDCGKQIGMDDTGPEVLYFQQFYNDNRPGYSPAIAEDGDFGPQTKGAAQQLGLSIPFSISQIPNSICQ